MDKSGPGCLGAKDIVLVANAFPARVTGLLHG
jgi:hypothetical protein